MGRRRCVPLPITVGEDDEKVCIVNEILEMASTVGDDDEKVCVVNEVFCASHPVEMVAKRSTGWITKSLFNVVDSRDEALMFQVAGTPGLPPKLIMLDAAGSPILAMRQKVFTVHGRWKIYRGDSSEEEHLLFQLKFSTFFQPYKNLKLDVFLASNTSEEKCDFHVDGNNSNKLCTIYKIYKGDSIVAEVGHISTFSESSGGKIDLMIRVYPYVDHAFITALVAILFRIKLMR